MDKQRRVVCAAIRFENGQMLLGARHWDGLMHKQFDGNARTISNRETQGFIDQRGVFMDRKEAWQVALAADQILYRFGGADGPELFSENLY